MIAGAFGSHGLKNRPDITGDQIHAWETASSYTVRIVTVKLYPCAVTRQRTQIYNGLALLLVSLHPSFAGPAIGIGGLVFSCTIMALVWNRDRYGSASALQYCGSE